MQSTIHSHQSGRDVGNGFTVIELAVSVVIFTIVMGAIYGMLQVARNSRLNTNQRAEAIQNCRIALNTLGRDAINAGVDYPNLGSVIPDDRISALLGGAADADTDADKLTPVYGENDVNSVNGTMTDQVTFVFVDDTFNGGTSLPISLVNGAGATLTVQAGSTNASCSTNDIYLVSGQSGAALGMLTGKTGTDVLNFASGDLLGLNNPGGTSPLGNIVPPASLQRVFWVTYFVADEDGNGTGTGTLRRRVFGGGTGWVDQPLAFGIENMQIVYNLVDGRVIDSPLPTDMDDIRQVRVSVTVRSPEVDPRTNQPFRQTLTASYSTRNLVFEKF